MTKRDSATSCPEAAIITLYSEVKPPAHSNVRLHGKSRRLASVSIGDRLVITTGKYLRVASIYDEYLIEGESMQDPCLFLSLVKQSGLKADLFTFTQRLPDTSQRYPYQHELETIAAIPITTFSHWCKAQADSGARKAVRRAERMGVTVKEVELDDALVKDICHIYNETPVRQGKLFRHYHEDPQSVKSALSTYHDRSSFLGAYYKHELIGFIQFTTVGPTATILQILSAQHHFDKRPTNALIAKAIEVCEMRGLSHFIYGNYSGYDPGGSLTEFKRRNGFQPISLPRYYIPLTMKGYAALFLNLHRGLAQKIPKRIMRVLLRMRASWNKKRYSRMKHASHYS
jgi:hypothetical protein